MNFALQGEFSSDADFWECRKTRVKGKTAVKRTFQKPFTVKTGQQIFPEKKREKGNCVRGGRTPFIVTF